MDGVERGLSSSERPTARSWRLASSQLGARRFGRRAARAVARHRAQGAQLGDVVVATDAFASLGELHASVHALRLRSVLAVPLIARGEALGVVYLDDRLRRGAFGAREVGWVRLLATHAALAVADARDAVRLRRAVRHAERANHRLARELAAREIELTHVKACSTTRPRPCGTRASPARARR
ncbi:MAG: GAF domain-containing protein [Polyangiaceae bacterium]